MSLSSESREHCSWLLREIVHDPGDNNVRLISQSGDFIFINRLVLASVSPVLKQFLLDEGDCIVLPDVKIEMLRKLYSVLLEANVQSQEIHNLLPLLEYLQVDFQLDESGVSQLQTGEKCSFCEETFPTFDLLESHVESCQKLAAQFSCDDCNQMFFRFEELKTHCQEVHGNLECETGQNGAIEFLIDGESEACLLRLEEKKIERKFECVECLKSFTTKLQLKHHLNIHLGLKPYSCEICNKSFTQPTHLKIHRRVHDGSKPYMCSVCGKTFAIGSNMRKHLAIHDREDPELTASQAELAVTETVTEIEEQEVVRMSNYPCTHCEAVFTTKRELVAHSAGHQETNPYFCKAPDCGQRFPTEKKLLTHERRSHGAEHCCTFCGKVCISASQLKKHILSHTGEKPFKCHICHKHFSQKSHATFHINTVHSTGDSEKKFSCPECGKSFSSSGVLKKHKMWHFNERPFQCELCPKSFVQKSHLKVHYAKHTGERPFLCLECGKSFTTKQHLKEHNKLHAGTKPWYQCTKCEAKYRGQTDLAIHMRRHTGEAPYQCREPSCLKSFRSLRSLENHSRIHSGDKPFLCENCSKAFTTASGLRQHFKHNVRCQALAKPGTFSSRISSDSSVVQELGTISIDLKPKE